MGVAILVVAWVVAIAGYSISKNSKMTADKLRAFAQSVDLRKLSGEARLKAIRELAEKMNRLSPEDRRKARLERVWQGWLEGMTAEEEGSVIDLTITTGFKLML